VSPVPLVETAPAKVNLTLRVLGRRDDGYHEIESLVAFADFGDRLSFSPGGELTLSVQGPSAADAPADDNNLVLKAVRALAARRPQIVSGAFLLDKKLPVAAGLGGGSSDAAAALRLIARASGLPPDDAQLHAAARATGADVPVCLDPRARIMRGVGDVLSAPLTLPPLPAVLVNPGVTLATQTVFASWKPASPRSSVVDLDAATKLTGRDQLLQFLANQTNDLESSAIALRPVIADVLAALRALSGCVLARMSGSGATCFALFSAAATAVETAGNLHRKFPDWWVKAVTLR
jgi:4-diphosphocytidyl-2-C-methyl-D-erythritol kinase